MTRDTETLFYNRRMIVDTKVMSEPRAWLISKVNRITPNGICRVTLAQDTFDQHNDYIEKDDDGNIIGMWADYHRNSVAPTPIIPDSADVSAKITCSGKPQFRIGGSPKTFTITYYDSENQEITDHAVGSWSLLIDGVTVPDTVVDLTITDNKVKVKFIGDDSYIGIILTIQNISEDVTASLDVEIIAL